MQNRALPALPLRDWDDTQHTLHLFIQIVGKIRMSAFPRANHWWHVPLYVTSRGLGTHPIPFGDRVVEVNFDFITHRLEVQCSNGFSQGFSLEKSSVADFYNRLMQIFAALGIQITIKAEPYDVPFSDVPFAEDETHASYDRVAVEKYWQILLFVNGVFERFRGRYLGKSTPVHLFWHHADLALTRFSGNKAPPLKSGTRADQDAYSHEVISFGFWAGDQNTDQPAFYTYTYPEPEGIDKIALKPGSAHWKTDYGYSMAFLSYEDVRQSADPEATLLEYLQHGYESLARLAGWDVKALALV